MGEYMIGGRGILLEWQAVAEADGYEVEASQGGAVQTPQVKISGESAEVTGLNHRQIYTFRVRALKQYNHLTVYSPWSDTLIRRAPTPKSLGHQEDHTVEYEVGSITPAPGLPSGIPDPAAVIQGSIGRAVTEWNTAAETIAGKNLNICKAGACGASNHDNTTITIQTAGETSPGQNESCAWSTACTFDVPSPRQGEHIKDIALVFEEPAWECKDTSSRTGPCPPSLQVRIYWTDVEGDQGEKAKDAAGNVIGEYYYIGPAMMHEFGHTFGLHDFYDDTTMDHLAAVMNDPYTNKTPTAEDIAQLRAIYAVHEPTEHDP